MNNKTKTNHTGTLLSKCSTKKTQSIMTEHPKIQPIEILLLEATTSFFDEKKSYYLSLPNTWPTTREIADLCDMDIYKARYFLLKLVKAGLIEMKTSNIHNSLRWCCIGHPSEPEIDQW